MNRRKTLALIGGGLTFGGLYGVNSLTQSVIAANVSVSNTSIQENQTSDDLQFNFDSFNLTTVNVNPDYDIQVILQGKIKGEESYTNIGTEQFIPLEQRNYDNKNISNQLDSVNLSDLNIMDELDEEGDSVTVEFKIILEHSDVNTITETSQTKISVTESDIPDSEGGHVSTITIDGDDYRIHAFTDVGEHTFTVEHETEVDILVVGGGGGGAGNDSFSTYGCGGGGAGGLIFKKNYSITYTNHSITVGSGGDGINTTGVGEQGGNSSFDDFKAIGGGGGWSDNETSDSSTLAGGSGGGGAGRGGPGGEGLQSTSNSNGFGYDGGDSIDSSSDSDMVGAGGGGSFEPGISAAQNPSGRDGYGGDGRYYGAEFGTNYGEDGYFAGGGGGGSMSSGDGGIGGIGGGGNGMDSSSSPDSAIDNTGGGGGGGTADEGGADGGSGIVLVRLGPL